MDLHQFEETIIETIRLIDLKALGYEPKFSAEMEESSVRKSASQLKQMKALRASFKSDEN